jgi:hypothetical protein
MVYIITLVEVQRTVPTVAMLAGCRSINFVRAAHAFALRELEPE